MSACTIHLVRHGEHGLQPGVLAGCSDVALTALGREQAAAVAGRLAGCGARAVLTSPVRRAGETAQLIAAALGVVPVVAAGLEEVDFGGWAGQSFDALAGLAAWQAWNAARGLARTPAGDSMLAVQARAVAALVKAGAAGGTLVAVSHADVIKAVLAHALGLSLELVHRFEIGLGSRSVLTLGDGWARVEAVNHPC